MDRPLRVAHLAKYYAPVRGGIESHVRSLAHAQAAAGAQVEVVCLGHDQRTTRIERDGPVRLTRAGRWGSVGKLDLCPALVQIIRRLDVDVIHAHVPNPSMILALLAARPATALVVGYHSDHVNQRLLRHAFRPAENLFFPRVDRILTTSPAYAAASDLLRRYPARVQTLPLGIDLATQRDDVADVEAEAARIRANFEGPLWFFCGRLVRYKGLEHAVHAMQSAPGTLLIAGEGPERELLRQRIAQAGLGQRAVLLGSVPDVRPYLRAARALWLPSINRSEAFGVVQLEAMAEGCPVLNTEIPGSGVPWVSQHGVSGLTVSPGDADALARAADELASDDQLRASLSRGARTRVQSFELSAIARQSLGIYRDVISARGSLGPNSASVGQALEASG